MIGRRSNQHAPFLFKLTQPRPIIRVNVTEHGRDDLMDRYRNVLQSRFMISQLESFPVHHPAGSVILFFSAHGFCYSPAAAIQAKADPLLLIDSHLPWMHQRIACHRVFCKRRSFPEAPDASLIPRSAPAQLQ